jgi:hypothetical protein
MATLPPDAISPADEDRWKALKRHVVRMLDGIDMALIEARAKPSRIETIENHLLFGLGEKQR